MIVYDPNWRPIPENWEVIYMSSEKHLGIRIDKDNHYNLRYISAYEGRSANRQILYLIRKCIMEFEKEHGKIELPDGKNETV